jgi:hypothetical protein
VTRHEAKYRAVVTNARHEAVLLTEEERSLIQVLDGEKTVAQLAGRGGSDVLSALERLAATALLCA